jgi:nucleoside-diphosphate-sugar epimerase
MRVAILGCGYVGLELGRQLAADHDVVGVRRSSEGIEAVRAAGLEAVQADVTDHNSLADVPDPDAVVFAASSGGRGAEAAREVYVEGLRTAIDHFCTRASQPDRVVYTSSTGVYGDHDGDWVDEATELRPSTPKTEVLAAAEAVALERPAMHNCTGTVARFGGIYGPERHRLSRYLDGPVTEGHVNLIHRADAAGAVGHLLESDLAREEMVNVVDDEPIWKPDFAAWLAEQCGVDPPATQTVAERLADLDGGSRAARVRAQKRVANDRLREYGYDFEFPTAREGYRPAIEAYLSGDE